MIYCINPFLTTSGIVCHCGLLTRNAGACLSRFTTTGAVVCLEISRGEQVVCCPSGTNQWT